MFSVHACFTTRIMCAHACKHTTCTFRIEPPHNRVAHSSRPCNGFSSYGATSCETRSFGRTLRTSTHTRRQVRSYSADAMLSCCDGCGRGCAWMCRCVHKCMHVSVYLYVCVFACIRWVNVCVLYSCVYSCVYIHLFPLCPYVGVSMCVIVYVLCVLHLCV